MKVHTDVQMKCQDINELIINAGAFAAYVRALYCVFLQLSRILKKLNTTLVFHYM